MKLKFIKIFLGFFFFLATCYGQSIDVSQYIKNNAIPIDTNADNNDLKDLASLKTVFEGRRIIGMGEATHGTQEFQVAKFRMFKYLVTQLNYKLFGIEANFTECRRVNDYILEGKGEAKKVIAGMYFWTWDTTEVLKMVEWMRNYNMNKPSEQKIKFYGFDMQYDVYAIQQITEKLKKLDNVYFNNNFKQLTDSSILNKGLYAPSTKRKRDSVVSMLIVPLKNYVNSQKSNLLKIYSNEDVEYNNRDIRLLEQYLDEDKAVAKDGAMSFNAINKRDKYMAENIEWILEHEGPESKIMLWAHNFHVSKNDELYARKYMGSYLKEKLKDQYYAIGFDFSKGSFQAVDTKTRKLKTFTVPDAKKGSSSYFFVSLNIPEFFIDIEKAVTTNSPAKNFFTQKTVQRSIGAAFNLKRDNYLRCKLYNYYDGLIFINETTATMLIK